MPWTQAHAFVSGVNGGSHLNRSFGHSDWRLPNANGDPIGCAGTGQDGESQSGVEWPLVRFVNDHDGTVGTRSPGSAGSRMPIA